MMAGLHEKIDPAGKPMKVVTKIDGNRFNEYWFKNDFAFIK